MIEKVVNLKKGDPGKRNAMLHEPLSNRFSDGQGYQTNCYVRWTQSLIHRQKTSNLSGFTIIETLITVVMIGLLSSLALPSFMSQVNRAKESEAKVNLSALKRSQYIFYLENAQFTNEIAQLTFPNPETEYYSYFVQGYPQLNGMVHLAFSKTKGMKSYGSVLHLRDGQLEECGLFPLNISQEHGDLEIAEFLFDAIKNYEQYCS